MAKTYKKYGVTTGGYRGERAILQERVIEGLQDATFSDQVLQLEPTSKQTIYLTSDNMADGNYIILPKASDLWPNWQVAIINESSYTCKIYYYTEDYTQLNLFKEVTGGNMVTCILLNDNTVEGTWTTLRTIEQASSDLLSKYTTNVLDPIEITWNELAQNDSDESDEHIKIQVSLGTILAGTAIKSIYLKTVEQFEFEEESDITPSISVSIGTDSDETHFLNSYVLTNVVADNNFSKDLFDEILSTNEDKEIYAYFSGAYFDLLKAGKLQIVVEKAKLIDPTILKNPIVQTQIPIGVIMNYTFPDIPEGYWRLDGSILPNAATAIPQFVKKLNSMNNQQPSTAKLIVSMDEWKNIKITYGSCSKFAWAGSGLKFPEINCFVQGLNSMNQLGQMNLAGLPNITGEFNAYGLNNGWGLITGAFESGTPNYQRADFQGGTSTSAKFDASRSNSIYGRSSTVQPDSIKYPYIISIYNKIQNASTLDLEALLEASVNKANINLNNLNQDGIDYISNVSKSSCVGKPNYNAALSLANNTTYNLSYDVWVLAHNEGVNFRAYMTINETTYAMSGYDDSDGHGSTCMIFFPTGTSFSFTGMNQIVAWPTI